MGHSTVASTEPTGSTATRAYVYSVSSYASGFGTSGSISAAVLAYGFYYAYKLLDMDLLVLVLLDKLMVVLVDMLLYKMLLLVPLLVLQLKQRGMDMKLLLMVKQGKNWN